MHKASETKRSFTWTEETQEAFENIKKRLSSTPILAFSDVKESFHSYTDASSTAMGTVLAQVKHGIERASCYASKAYSKSQTNYYAKKTETFSHCNFHSSFQALPSPKEFQNCHWSSCNAIVA